jgi:hypothetical protein
MPTITSTNPGTVDVSRQAYPPAPSRAATPSSNALSTSNGENQFPASRQTRVEFAISEPTSGRGLPLEVHPASTSCVRPTATATAVATAVHGLPSEIHPASCARPIPVAVADTTSPARDVRADSSRPGGLPVNVNIR